MLPEEHDNETEDELRAEARATNKREWREAMGVAWAVALHLTVLGLRPSFCC